MSTEPMTDTASAPNLDETLDRIEGHLEAVEAPAFDTLDFDWEGIHFHATSREGAAGASDIRLHGKLGRLFFTIEDPVQRASAIERVYATNRGIDGAYRIDRKGFVHFESVTTTDTVLKGNALMSALTLILLEAETHLRALRSHLKAIN